MRVVALAAGLAMVAMTSAMPARAAVTSTNPNGFVSRHSALVPAAPAAVWATLTAWHRWWPAAHSYTGKAEAFSLDPHAGGVLAERWNGAEVTHAQVLMALPARMLRLSGGFGPLQAMPVGAIMDFTLESEGTITRLTLTYTTGGPPFTQLDTFAGPVDAVLTEAFTRLVDVATPSTSN